MLGSTGFGGFPGTIQPCASVLGIPSNYNLAMPSISHDLYSGKQKNWESKQSCTPQRQEIPFNGGCCYVQQQQRFVSPAPDDINQSKNSSHFHYFCDFHVPKPINVNSSCARTTNHVLDSRWKEQRISEFLRPPDVLADPRYPQSSLTAMSVEGLLNPSHSHVAHSLHSRDPQSKSSRNEGSCRKVVYNDRTENRKRAADDHHEDETPLKRKWKVVLTPELAVTVFRLKPPGNAKKSSSINLSQRYCTSFLNSR